MKLLFAPVIGLLICSAPDAQTLPVGLNISSGACQQPQSTSKSMAQSPTAVRDKVGIALIAKSLAALDPAGLGVPQDLKVQLQRVDPSGKTLAEVWSVANKSASVEVQGATPFTIRTGTATTISLGGRPLQKSTRSVLSFGFINPVLPQFTLLERLLESNYSISVPNIETVDGRSVETVESICAAAPWLARPSYEKWYFDRETKIPIRVDYFIGSVGSSKGYVPTRLRFSGAATVDQMITVKTATEETWGHITTITASTITAHNFTGSLLHGAGQ